MSTHAEGSFGITARDEAPHAELGGDLALTRARAEQTYAGAIEGVSTLEYLMIHREEEGASAVFTGYERIEGALEGKTGSFTVEHRGRFEGGVAQSEWTVVEGSGTGALAGLTGEGRFRSAEHGRADYAFTFAIG